MPGRWNMRWEDLYSINIATSGGAAAFDFPGELILAASVKLVDNDSVTFISELQVRNDGRSGAGGWERLKDVSGNVYFSESPSVETIEKIVWFGGHANARTHGAPINSEMRLVTTIVGGTNGTNTAQASVLVGSSNLLNDFKTIKTFEMFNQTDLPDGSTKTFASLGSNIEGKACLLGLYHQGTQGAAPPSWSVVMEVQDPLTSTWNRVRDTAGGLVAVVSGSTGASLDDMRGCGTTRTQPYIVIPPGSRLIYDDGGAGDHDLELYAILGFPAGV